MPMSDDTTTTGRTLDELHAEINQCIAERIRGYATGDYEVVAAHHEREAGLWREIADGDWLDVQPLAAWLLLASAARVAMATASDAAWRCRADARTTASTSPVPA